MICGILNYCKVPLYLSLESYILAGDYSGRELLERCIILEGVAAIQKGLHPKVAKEFLLSFLGEESYTVFEEKFHFKYIPR